ncbi:uncharacterized protein YALI1_F16232g [Yarrowia lipolytica]|uniref:Uncharacterized protein n=1 Tax=Yarrowia lipolytica TaxID=4952 RepID=A0A1D8NN23_YARLL|nr:hypothetical protein YALI1_F16232g [Yarrowia lipolytica]
MPTSFSIIIIQLLFQNAHLNATYLVLHHHRHLLWCVPHQPCQIRAIDRLSVSLHGLSQCLFELSRDDKR